MIKTKSWRLNKSEGDKPRRKGTPNRRNIKEESHRPHMSREQRIYLQIRMCFRSRETL